MEKLYSASVWTSGHVTKRDCLCESLKVAFVTCAWMCAFVSLQLNLPIMNRMSASLDLTASVHSQPPLMGNVDPSKVDEIRRTVYVGNLNSQVTSRRVCARPWFLQPLGFVCGEAAVQSVSLSTDHHCRAAAGVLQAGGRCKVCADGWRRDSADALRLCGVCRAGIRRQSPDL